MRGPFIFLRSEISRNDASNLIRWLQNEEVTKFLSDTSYAADDIARVMENVNLPVLTHLFNKEGRFYMAYNKHDVPIGFVRLLNRKSETEIVLAVGDSSNWGKGIGAGIISESLKIAFFEMRTPKVVAKIHKANKRSIRAFLSAGFNVWNETNEIKCYTLTLEEYIKSIRSRKAMAEEIYITEVDMIRLKQLIDEQMSGKTIMDESLRSLNAELKRANIVDPKELPGDVISMNSRVLLHMDDKALEASLVYPHDADWTENKISVLSPVGTAILGYRQGARVKWPVPSGEVSIEIKKVMYQPEAAGDYHL